MKLKTKLSNKAIDIISIVSVFAMLIGIAAPITADCIAKENTAVANATERTTTSIVDVGQASAFSWFVPMGNSISEDISGLAFAFETSNIDGITINGTDAVYDNATVSYKGKKYKLLGMGAIAHNKEAGKLYTVEECNGSSIINVPIKYIFNHEKSEDGKSDFYRFAVRIKNIPQKAHNTHLTVIPYFTIELNGKVTNIIYYRSVYTRSFTEVSEGKKLNDCEAILCYVNPGDNALCFQEVYSPQGSSALSKISEYIVLQDNVVGNLVNKDRIKIDIDKYGTVTIDFTCRYHNTKHIITIPKECRFHLL